MIVTVITDHFHRAGVWLYPALILICAGLLSHFIIKNLLKKLHTKALKTHNIWDEALTESARAPLNILVWLIVLTIMFHMLLIRGIIGNHDWISGTLNTLYIITASWFFFRFISRLEKLSLAGKNKKPVDITTVIALAKLTRIIVAVIALLTLMQTHGFSISGLLAFGGVGGIAVGFAAKDLLSNFFGSLTIYLDNPFKVGDWIRTPEKSIEGTVEYIGWRQTRIRTFDRRPLHVPNSTFVNIAVENASRMQNRRIKTVIGLRYKDSDKLDKLLEELRNTLSQHEALDHGRLNFIYFNNFGHSTLDCLLYCFTKTTKWTEWLAIQERLFLEIINIIHKHGADIAFPTRTIDWPESLIEKEGKHEQPE